MKNFRDELRLITNNTEWTDNEKFEAIDELHERYVIHGVVGRSEQLCEVCNNDGVFEIGDGYTTYTADCPRCN